MGSNEIFKLFDDEDDFLNSIDRIYQEWNEKHSISKDKRTWKHVAILYVNIIHTRRSILHQGL